MECYAEIVDWAAWAPGIETQQDWREWLCRGEAKLTPHSQEDAKLPSMKFLPLANRKKLSVVTKISLWLAHSLLSGCSERQIRTVFASRHGESSATFELLDSIVHQQPLSPVAFSRSVHNTASGLFGIAEQVSQSTTAISAMENTFLMGLVQATAELDRHSHVLYVMADEELPRPFECFLNEPWGPYGVGLLLQRSSQTLPSFAPKGEIPHAVSFLSQLIALPVESSVIQ